jgi:integrase
MKLNEWVETYWEIINIKPQTVANYKGLYRRNLAPFIGECEVDDVSPIELQMILLKLSPYNSRYTLMVAKSIYREALMYKVAKVNPTIGLRTPRINKQPKKFLTWEQVNALDWGRYNNQIRFLALHGLRWSEAAALTENDIQGGFVWVSKSVHGDVKSESSNRKVPYLGFFEKFPASYKTLRLAANRHGVTVHSFRRTFAYLLKTQNIHVTTAQKLLGHSDPILTLKVYTSVLDSEIDEVGSRLEKYLDLPRVLFANESISELP